jgi:hypothetical protein
MSYEELSQIFTVKWNFTHDGDEIGCEGSTFEVHFRGDYVRHDVDTDMGNKEEYEVEISAEWVTQVSGPKRYRQKENGTIEQENMNFLLDHFREQAIESMEEEANS